MKSQQPLRLLLRTTKPHLPHSRSLTTTTHLSQSPSDTFHDSRLPRVANPSFWASLIPKPLRRSNRDDSPAATTKKPKTRSPYAIFIFLGILIGSNAINTIALKNDSLNYNRKTDAKLELLREVVGKLKKGEEVDVKRILGTGDPKAEEEWEEVMREVESVDPIVRGRGRYREKLDRARENDQAERERRQRHALEQKEKHAREKARIEEEARKKLGEDLEAETERIEREEGKLRREQEEARSNERTKERGVQDKFVM